MTTAQEGGEGSASRPGRSLLPGKTRYPLYRRLGGPQGPSGQVRKISPPTGIRSPDRPARNQSLYRLRYLVLGHSVKGKAVPLQDWSGPEGSRKLKFLDFMTTAQDGCKFVRPMHRPHLPPRKYSWYSFLLEAESTPGR
jgi:hypothetical protein